MASRLSLTQSRAGYIGTSTSANPNDGEFIVIGKVGVGVTSPSQSLEVSDSAIIGRASTATTTTNIENKLIVKGKNNYSDGTTWYGDYGQILLSASNNMTASARQFLITNALENNKFAIVRSADWSTTPVVNSLSSGVDSGFADFVIDNTGNVGIGTTDPTRTLHIVGGDGGAGTHIAQFEGRSGVTGMYIRGDGNVGIGTTSPSGKFEIKSSATNWTTAPAITFTDNAGVADSRWIVGNIATNYGSFNIAQSDSATTTTYTPRITILDNGNVGIGTTSPAAKLNIRNGNSGKSYSNQSGLLIDVNGTSNSYSSLHIGSSASADNFVVTNAGNVGIGTSGPQGKLHVDGGIALINVSDDWQQSTLGTNLIRGGNFNNTISEESTSIKVFPVGIDRAVGDYWGGIGFMHLDPENSGWGTSYPGEHFWIGGRVINQPGQERSALVFATNNATTAGTHSSEKMVILPDGNVGIGTTNPTRKLQITDGEPIMRFNPTTVAGDYRFHAGDGKFYLTPEDTGIPTITASSGNVGIGTTSPGYKLDVNGNIRGTGVSRFNHLDCDSVLSFGLFTAGSRGTQFEGYSTHSVVRTDSDKLDFYMGNSSGGVGTMMTLLKGGNVGIGTTSPQEKLEVNGVLQIRRDGDHPALRFAEINSGTTTTRGYIASGDWAVNGGAIDDFGISGSVTGDLLLATNAGTERLRIQNSTGNVGIGTDSPLFRLDVHNSGSGIRHYGNATNQLSTFCYGAYQVMIATNGTITNEFGYAAGNFYVQTNDEERFRITSAGNVGIATTNPRNKLDIALTGAEMVYPIATGTNPTGGFRIGHTDTTWAGVELNMGIANASAQGYPAWIQAQNPADLSVSRNLLLNPNGGNVGIGTTQPGQMLDVYGNIECDSLYLNNASSLYFGPAFFGARIKANCGGLLVQDGSTYQAVYASAFSVQSDYRLKSNVVPLDNAIDRLKQMSVHRFNWNDRLDEPKVDGFIAHELSEVVPEAVLGEKDATKEDGTPDYQGIDQSKIVPLLTAALQEALAKIESLEQRILTLENK